MKKLLLISVLASTLIIICSECWAQTPASNEIDEFTLEEIIVTAEKREADIQKTATSIYVVDGNEMAELGKIFDTEILHNIPNVTLAGGGTDQNQIIIRGVLPTRIDPGVIQGATTALYIDGVYGGIGRQLDLDNVVVMRGPQGTLYGRSAAGGVVSFQTKDPVMEEFSGFVNAQVGTADLKNSQAVINVPLGEKIAFRMANHYYEKGSYYSREGGWERQNYSRIKMGFQPTDELDTTLTVTHSIEDSTSEGNSPSLDDPITFNYIGYRGDLPVTRPVTDKRIQVSLDAKYDFGPAVLNYLSAIHRPYDIKLGPGFSNVHATAIVTTHGIRATNTTWNHELRLNSDTDGRLTWIVGTNYYSWDYESISTWIASVQYLAGGELDPDPNALEAVQMYDYDFTTRKQYGVFSSNTYELRDNLRLTAGLRYDRNEIIQTMDQTRNSNRNAVGSVVRPYIWESVTLDHYKSLFKHFTFNARADYDLAPDRLIYASISDAYIPGETSVAQVMDPDTGESRYVVSLMEQMHLIAYEVGSKNRFLDDRVQVNAALFFNDYAGYRSNIELPSVGGPPERLAVNLPVNIYGMEVDTEWLFTPQDRLTFSIGYNNSKIREFPVVQGINTRDYFIQEELPSIIPLEGNVIYQHNFNFANGSVLLSRVNVEFQNGYYTVAVSPDQAAFGNAPYSWQKSLWLGDINLTWTSPNGMYTLAANVENFMDVKYKYRIVLSRSDLPSNQVWAADPRVYSLMLNVRF